MPEGDWRYRIFGLSFSSDRELRFFTPAPVDASRPDFRFVASATRGPDSIRVHDLPRTATRLGRAPGGYRLVFGAGETVAFSVVPPGCVDCAYGIADIGEISAFLMGPVIACLLRARGELALHGCVVRIADRAVAVLGASGRGKSTLAAAFATRGHALLADDIAVLRRDDAGWRTWPGSPAIKLWPGSLRSLGEAAPVSTPLFRSLDKRVAALSVGDSLGPWRFQPDPLPLAALYVLAPREAELSVPQLVPLDPLAAVQQLMVNRSLAMFSELNEDVGAREFVALAGLARDLPVRSLACPDGLDRLDDTIAAIVRDVGER